MIGFYYMPIYTLLIITIPDLECRTQPDVARFFIELFLITETNIDTLGTKIQKYHSTADVARFLIV